MAFAGGYSGRIDPLVLPRPVSYRDFIVATVAVGLDTVLFTSLMEVAANRGWTAFDASSAVVVLLNLVPLPVLALRRHAPVAVSLVLCAYAAVLTLSMGSRPLLSLLVALYTAAALRPLRRSWWCLVATLGAHSFTVLYESTAASSNWATIIAVAVVFTMLDLTAWFFGRWAALTSRRAQELVETREARAAEAVKAERLRIARELHDIVAHAVTLMVLQASGAKRQLTRDPVLAETALDSVETLGRQAIGELRRLLEVLRTVAETDEDISRAEITAKLANLPVLVEHAATSGVSVDLSMPDLTVPFDPSVEMAAYRVVQEALTNVTRHAGPGSHADVVLCQRGGVLIIDVDNDVAGTVPSVTQELSSGYGLAGLRERVKLMGGDITVGPGSDRRYHLHATLPTVAP
jgi:signal transduction histidine kinase